MNNNLSAAEPIAENPVTQSSDYQQPDMGPSTEERLRVEVFALRKLRDEALSLLNKTHHRQETENQTGTSISGVTSNSSKSTVSEGKQSADRLALITQAENERLQDMLQRLSLEKTKSLCGAENEENSGWLAAVKTALERDIYEIDQLIKSLKKPKVEEEVIEESRGSQLLKNELSAMKARQIVAFTADTDETKSPAHVRRTIRVIEQELNSRIEMLKTSQPDMEDFLARIQQYKDEHRRKAKKDIIVSNCARVKQFKREVRLEMLHKRKIEHDNHIKKIVEYKKAKDEEERLHVEHEMAERERLAGMSKAAREVHARIQREAEVRQKWFYLVLIGSRLYTIQKSLLDYQITEENRVRREKSSLVIQRAWYRYRRQASMKRISTAKVVLARFIRKYMPRLRARLKRQAADMITTFLTDSHTASRLMNVIKKFRYSVLLCQKQIRAFTTIRRHQYQLLQMQWDKYEPIWWERRQRGKSNIALNANGSESKLNGSKGNLAPRKARYGRQAANDAPVQFKVPGVVRNRLIRQRLKQICEQYGDIYMEQTKKRNEWYKQYRLKMNAFSALTEDQSTAQHPETAIEFDQLPQIEGLRTHPKTGRPMLMTNCVLLSATEMITLIERGYAEATADKK